MPVAGLAVTRASTNSMCSLRGLFLKALLLVFRRVAAWSHFHLPLPNCFPALQGAEGLVQIGLISDQTQFSTVGLVELKKNLHNPDSGRAHFMERPGKMVFFFFVVFFLIICLNFAAFCLISGHYLHIYTLSRYLLLSTIPPAPLSYLLL